MKTIKGLVVLTAITVVLLSGVWDVLAQQKTLQPQVNWKTSLAEATNLSREMEMDKNLHTRQLAQELQAMCQSIYSPMIDGENLMAQFLKLRIIDRPTATKTANELNTLSERTKQLMLKLQRPWDQKKSSLIQHLNNILKQMNDMQNAITQVSGL